ncbi:MAG: Argininosuccinate synthase [Alphaproteobacteria bacterium MarineAlpha9_Bin4]|nr:argininosuccinate synthase [Pelagibacterales bacterium]PPR25473.1 MAG: Argininosuccinate synthase [Alphaproteobacteria bacterium MarineAlpha9_Bin4]|tara:strand:- start:633 stop:1814 length:1182 start_codon:yes stop_codon:yes gene_type:complete
MKKKIVLAYSGGLDTSVILKWLQLEKNLDVIAFIADVGQRDELEIAKKNAIKMGASKVIVKNLKNTFVKEYVFPMFRCNTLYEGTYLLGTAIARPLIAKTQMEVAKKFKAEFVSHGATGKGNDQIRFELGYYAFKKNIKIIAPWREWDLNSRVKLINYANKHGIPLMGKTRKEPPYSMDANLLHISYEGKILEDPWKQPEKKMFRMTKNPESCSSKGEVIEIGFLKGDPISINSKKFSPEQLLENLNIIGGKHGIGRKDIVENRTVGMKSRGVYETPGGEILLIAHRAMESLTLDGPSILLKDEIMPKYAKLIYDGLWFSPERKMLQALIDESQNKVTGKVRLLLRQGCINLIGRKSKNSLYNEKLATFEEDNLYNQKDAQGFIKLNALRFRT